MRNFFLNLKEKLAKKEPEIEDNVEDYVELGQESAERSKVVVRPFVLDDFEDIRQILDSLREGFTVALINIRPLKEKDLPDLCADRIDYSLRTATVFREIENGKYFIANLLAENGQWIFKNFESARKYAKLFLKLNTDYYAGLPSAVTGRTVGDYLRYALLKNYISETDLYTTNKIVLEKIEPHIKTDSKLNLLFDRMNNKIGFRNDPNDYSGKVFCKSRVVNPLCWHGGKIKRVSEIEPSWNDIIERESRPKEYFLKFEK